MAMRKITGVISEKYTTTALDGRRVAYHLRGAAGGFPIFIEHGMPGCGEGPLPRAIVLYWMGVLAISRDRPGYCESDRQPGRRIVDGVSDIRAIADELGLDRFGVAGRSGGGPYALATAAKLSERVTSALVMVGMAPQQPQQAGDSGMVDSNKKVFEGSDQESIEDIARRYQAVKENPSSLLQELESNGDLRLGDRRVLSDFSLRHLIETGHERAMAQGPYGWIDDVLAAKRPWGFELSEVEVPVRIWQGSDDGFTPPANAYALAAAIGSANTEVILEPGRSHFESFVETPDLFAQMAAGQRV